MGVSRVGLDSQHAFLDPSFIMGIWTTIIDGNVTCNRRMNIPIFKHTFKGFWVYENRIIKQSPPPVDGPLTDRYSLLFLITKQ